jgi:hypothetical protein
MLDPDAVAMSAAAVEATARLRALTQRIVAAESSDRQPWETAERIQRATSA